MKLMAASACIQVAHAVLICQSYNKEILRIMTKFGATCEAEVLTGYLVEQAGVHRRKKMDLRQQILLEVGVVRAKYHALFQNLPYSSRWPSDVNSTLDASAVISSVQLPTGNGNSSLADARVTGVATMNTSKCREDSTTISSIQVPLSAPDQADAGRSVAESSGQGDSQPKLLSDGSHVVEGKVDLESVLREALLPGGAILEFGSSSSRQSGDGKLLVGSSPVGVNSKPEVLRGSSLDDNDYKKVVRAAAWYFAAYSIAQQQQIQSGKLDAHDSHGTTFGAACPPSAMNASNSATLASLRPAPLGFNASHSAGRGSGRRGQDTGPSGGRGGRSSGLRAHAEELRHSIVSQQENDESRSVNMSALSGFSTIGHMSSSITTEASSTHPLITDLIMQQKQTHLFPRILSFGWLHHVYLIRAKTDPTCASLRTYQRAASPLPSSSKHHVQEELLHQKCIEEQEKTSKPSWADMVLEDEEEEIWP
ncbi:hypothetical protein CEUSTIGMA_g11820.t1 [Chlamydomonas eustigma]|uniref:Uncharacterized protein n=1 Tax=Chlamydomonas eustigma TaxID=1157962 RepID=A0A250XMV9_9CHLO|nr:hypothetical protein CEUSTIGMA_g11820.t1 [Chlamydomonas eustigma]|eukprot:GAX84398.1 hypothetical protein CEUSTIGMA_g11820.t1 [Chlamydomonas eustigma]